MTRARGTATGRQVAVWGGRTLRLRRLLAVGALVAVAAPAGQAAASARAGAAGQPDAVGRAGAPGVASPCAAAPGVQVRQAGRFVVTLKVGPVPHMYTVAEAARLKPAAGVVMLEPMRSAGGGMAAGAGRKYVRIQVCDRATGRALRAPRPTAAFASGMSSFMVPLTLGYDIGSPPSDVRYGQVLQFGSESATVSVRIAGQVAPFSVLPGA